MLPERDIWQAAKIMNDRFGTCCASPSLALVKLVEPSIAVGLQESPEGREMGARVLALARSASDPQLPWQRGSS